ncbi:MULTISPECIES: amylo-alpha-1,6-glucosidase [unclassified Nodularia (in: cyanobacteria)]|uniref:amylo-alpha-1,6-glucosidase n=1 Tax=unclassified Nodularia (in: cyanobacteria) TaxID=2656917 RepID=UPI00187F6099|nr:MULTISPECIES: amylo-alpha-1,6-glucosidase [unclassified Nodularia (in: cyanobacteria)]MBE9199055.1 amylo-alpha-1,6-glucosidase [Nodularia sp. LEGE 06071]MCC2694057.1 amylo-alpha-1,6-glucosidase [Nodularia sp. LEGE 04288]
MRVTVGPPILTINHGSTFMATDLGGEINPHSHLGIFSDDTRFLSDYACYVDGKSWIRLTSATTTYYAARVYLINPQFTSTQGKIAQGDLSLIISRTVEQGIHEDLDITNNASHPVNFNLEIALASDFADIFEVASQQYVRRGHIETKWQEAENQLETSYKNDTFYRCLIYKPCNFTSQPHYANGRVTFDISLEPSETWHTCCKYHLIDHQHVREAVNLCYQAMLDPAIVSTEIERLHCQWRDSVTGIVCANEDLVRLYRQSVEDLGSLRLYDYDFEPDIWLPAAGVPKFVTLFGRDSLIISLQNMIVHPGFARGALQKLGQLQATELDDWRDAQPGKILHEVRQGELAYFSKVPHTPYYGTADATPLFLITLHETWKWLGDDSLLQNNRDRALRCLEWIDNYGDLDGDGFQEYQTQSSGGIENQGWKDSGDAVVYPDGSQVKAPKALCELQGYVFDAWMRMAEVFDVLGEGHFAQELRTKAAKLQVSFEEHFWSEDLECYVFCLDPEKQPVRSLTSNAGHCLWSGIASPERAARVVKRLMQPDMWSGWGIRTLSTENPAYNPYSYHLGSIWPHDNGIIAMGFKRYGFAAEVAEVAHGTFDAAKYFASYRLPELFAGIKREAGAFPVPYIEANVPQGWAAASVFHLIQAMLGLQADAPNQLLYVDPHIPKWLPEIELQHVEIGNSRVDLQFWREGEITHWDAVVKSGEVEVKQQTWQPWRTDK